MAFPCIVIVEDENLVALDIRRQLAAMGYDNVCTARSAEKALELAEKHPPDLALLDINLAGTLDGVELGEQLRVRYGSAIVYLTAFADTETINRAKLTDPYGFLVKPLDERELYSTVEIALYRQKIEQRRLGAESKEREFKDQLLQTEKMAAVGKLSAGVAHELNNQLLAIVLSIDLASTDKLLNPQVKKQLQRSINGCNRSAALIKQLLTFTGHGTYSPKVVMLQKVVDETVSSLSQVIRDNIRVSVANESKELSARVDRELVQQAIRNLLMNARDATPNGGKIELAIDYKYVSNPRVHNSEAEPGIYVTLGIRDDGDGIDEEHINRIFEPFFTTKPVGEGTGMGLSVVYGIMQRHGGWVELNSEREKATTFTLYFPQAHDPIEISPRPYQQLEPFVSRGYYGANIATRGFLGHWWDTSKQKPAIPRLTRQQIKFPQTSPTTTRNTQ